MEELYATPELRARTKRGDLKFWQGFVGANKLGVFTYTTFWQELSDGTMSVQQTSALVEIEPKNVGKKNETSLLEQAKSEINAAMKRQRDKKGYREAHEPPAPDEPLLPMLAEKYLESSDKLDWSNGVYAQAKLDGTRALYDGTRFTTRGGLEHPAFLAATLGFNTLGRVLDGELLLDPTAPCCKGLSKVERFQLSLSAVKKNHPHLTPYLRYHAYDVVDDNLSFCRRYAVLEALWKGTTYADHDDAPWPPPPFTLVEAYPVADDAAVLARFAIALEAGYEGVMLRDNSGGYELGQRSYQLQKLKECEDAEFTIVGIVDGKGKDKGTAKLNCVTSAGVAFDARLMGKLELRQEVYANRADYIGKQATVRFEGFSKDGKPRFPRALTIREEGT